MNKIIIFFVFIVFSLSGCFAIDEHEEVVKAETQLGELKINYYSNKSVSSLDIPPDLTKPEDQKAFRIAEYVPDLNEEVINLSNKPDLAVKKSNILKKDPRIKVKKNGDRRWLEVEKSPEILWDLTKEFFKLEGFAIKKFNKEIGILETDFLENRPNLPDQSLGLIRSMIQSVTAQRYSMPVIDKYRVRIEPTDNEGVTQIFLTLNSMKEIVDPNAAISGNTIWVEKDRDVSLENEMLLRFMVFLGGEKTDSIEKIIAAKETKEFKALIEEGINGYAKMTVESDFLSTWDNISWALDKENVPLEDKDLMERSFYIKMARTADQGIMTYIFGDDAVEMTFQIQLKKKSDLTTEVYFNDITEANEQDTKDFSFDFFNKLIKHFS